MKTNNRLIRNTHFIRNFKGGMSYPQKKAKKAPVDWDSFVIPSERGLHVDEYMKEMRENDRL